MSNFEDYLDYINNSIVDLLQAFERESLQYNLSTEMSEYEDLLQFFNDFGDIRILVSRMSFETQLDLGLRLVHGFVMRYNSFLYDELEFDEEAVDFVHGMPLYEQYVHERLIRNL